VLIQTTLIHAALFVAVLLTPLAVTSADEQLTPAEAKEIAKEAFLWGMHPIAIYHLRYNFAQNELNPRAAGINRLNWDRTPMKDLPRVATTPIATTLYGVGMFDLPQEPAVIIVSEIEDRYWSVQLHDNYARWWHMVSLVLSDPSFTKHIDSHREVTAFAHFERLRLKVGTPLRSRRIDTRDRGCGGGRDRAGKAEGAGWDGRELHRSDQISRPSSRNETDLTFG
jgi:hypothetical protein